MIRPFLAFFCALSALAQQEGATVTGRVTDTLGNPIAKATVFLKGSGSQQPRRTDTAADGTYSFTDIEPGRHSLQAIRNGYVPGDLGVVPGNARGSFNLTLTPTGSISGRITDENGDPVSGVTVQAMRQVRGEDGTVRFSPVLVSGLSIHPAVTDNSGQYKILNLPPGAVYISASGVAGGNSDLFDIVGLRVDRATNFASAARPGQRPEAWVTTWYPRASDGKLSTPIDTAAGRNISGVNIQLRKTALFHISGKLASPDLGPIRIQVFASDGRFPSGSGTEPGKDGAFQVNGLPPGDYYLGANGATPATIGLFGIQRFTIIDKDIDGLAPAVTSPAEIHGMLTIDGRPPDSANHQPLTVSLIGDGPPYLYSGQTAKVASDGSFSIPRTIPGAYRLRLGNEGNAYLSSLLVNGDEVGGSTFTLGSGASMLQVTLRSATGEIRATVQPDSRGVTSNFALIVPEPHTTGVTWRYKEYGSAGEGMFVFSQLPPGVYRIYAMGPVDQSTFDPDTLSQYESQSVKVTVNGSESVFTTVQSIAAAAR